MAQRGLASLSRNQRGEIRTAAPAVMFFPLPPHSGLYAAQIGVKVPRHEYMGPSLRAIHLDPDPLRAGWRSWRSILRIRRAWPCDVGSRPGQIARDLRILHTPTVRWRGCRRRVKDQHSEANNPILPETPPAMLRAAIKTFSLSPHWVRTTPT